MLYIIKCIIQHSDFSLEKQDGHFSRTVIRPIVFQHGGIFGSDILFVSHDDNSVAVSVSLPRDRNAGSIQFVIPANNSSKLLLAVDEIGNKIRGGTNAWLHLGI